MNDNDINKLLDPILSDENIWAHEPNFTIAKFELYDHLRLQGCSREDALIVIEELYNRWVPMIKKYHNELYGPVKADSIRVILN